jgi:hypothetical protein
MPLLISQTSESIVDGALQEALLSISPESRKKLAHGASQSTCYSFKEVAHEVIDTALLQENALDDCIPGTRDSISTSQTSIAHATMTAGGTRQVSSPPSIPRPPTKKRRREYHLIKKMGLDKNKPEEHMKYKQIQMWPQ